MDCLFCGIAEKSVPADILYEDDEVIAFRDINPQAPTHALVIPRKHIATINDIDEEDYAVVGRLFGVAKKIAADLGFAEPGFRVVMNCNKDGQQTVYHIHLHVLGGRAMTWPPG